MKATARNSSTTGNRILQGVAITSALLLGAGYVWWAQDKATARATYMTDREILTEAAPVENPTHPVLISGSKSLQGVVPVGQTLDSSGLADIVNKLSTEQARTPRYTPGVLISGSKAETVIHSVVNSPPVQQPSFSPSDLAASSKTGTVEILIDEKLLAPTPVPAYSADNIVSSSKKISRSRTISIGERVPVPTPNQAAQTTQNENEDEK